jgi:hypothetical protein
MLTCNAVNAADKKRIDDILQRCKQEAAEIHEEERELGLEGKRIENLAKEHKAELASFFIVCMRHARRLTRMVAGHI